MQDYNDLRRITRLACTGIALLASLALSGCATRADADRTANPADEATITPLGQTAPPSAELVSDAQLRQALRSDASLRYVVKEGDTLWDIANHFLDRAWYWPEVWYENQDIRNPHLIYPGDVLLLTNVDQRPAVILSPRVRESPLDQPIATIPAAAIEAMLNAPYVLSKEELAQAPHIVSFENGHLIGGERTLAFIRGLRADDPLQLDIVHPDEPLYDLDQRQQLGILALPTGRLQIIDRGADIATGRITGSKRETHPGDRLLPARTRIEVSDFELRAPTQPVAGKIIATYSDAMILGQYEVVILNLGEQDGLRRGNLLQILRMPTRVQDPIQKDMVELPALTTGVLMVFDVGQKLSLGIILDASHPVRKHDLVRAPGA